MQPPGSNPHIPEEATLTFREQWNRAKPGTKHKIAFLQLEDGGRLAVFPHRDWNPPVHEGRDCVLFPVRNAAVAAPVGGISDEERLFPEEDDEDEEMIAGPARAPLFHNGHVPDDLRREVAERINVLLEPAYKALNQIEDLVRELDPDLFPPE